MAGAQALVAHKGKPPGPITVETYDLKGYHEINKGPISYNVSSISGEESSGAITIFATWVIPHGKMAVSQVWQVGPMVAGTVGKHAFDQANLAAKKKLSLTGSSSSSSNSAGSPADSPSGSSSAKTDTSAPAPGTGAGERLVSGVLALGAIVVSLFV